MKLILENLLYQSLRLVCDASSQPNDLDVQLHNSLIMHPLLYLLATLVLADHAIAFVPYKHPVDAGSAGSGLRSLNRRSTSAIKRSGQFRSTERKKHLKRENEFDINMAITSSHPNSVGINYDEAGDLYFSTAKFGTSDEEYQLLIDTGATESWVMGSSCKVEACSLHTTLGPEDSTTHKVCHIMRFLKVCTVNQEKVLDDSFSRTYGSGKVDGTLATDDMKLAGFEFPFTFGLAVNVTSNFGDFAMDGLLGLGRAGPSSSQTARLLDRLSEEQLIPAKLYGIHLARKGDEINDGELNFGAPNTDRYDGDLSYTNVVPDSEFWEIPIEGFSIDGDSLDFGARTAIIDSGSSFVVMPPADAERLHNLIPGSDLVNDEYTIPCNTRETVKIKFSGKNFDISSADYVGPIASEDDEETCLSNFIAVEVFSDTQWVIGAVFMRNVYSVFDLDEDRIGFGVKSGMVTKTEAGSENGENDEEDSETANADVTAGSEGSDISDDDETEASSSSQDEGDLSMSIYPIAPSAVTAAVTAAATMSTTETYKNITIESFSSYYASSSSFVILSTAETDSTAPSSTSPSPTQKNKSSHDTPLRASLVTFVLDDDDENEGQPLTKTVMIDVEASSSSQSSSSNIAKATSTVGTDSLSLVAPALESEENAAVCTISEAKSYLALIMAILAAFMLLH